MSRLPHRNLGLALVGLGLLANKYVLQLAAPDQSISSLPLNLQGHPRS